MGFLEKLDLALIDVDERTFVLPWRDRLHG